MCTIRPRNRVHTYFYSSNWNDHFCSHKSKWNECNFDGDELNVKWAAEKQITSAVATTKYIAITDGETQCENEWVV